MPRNISEDKMISMDTHTADVVRAGQAAWGRVRSQESWQDWLAIGHAIEAGRIAMMNYLRTNNPNGRVWSEKFGAWLKETGFDAIAKPVRSNLSSCLAELPQIEEWRRHIGLGEAMKYTHPSTVWRKYKAATKIEQDKGEKAEEKRAKSNLEASIERLEAASDRLEREQLMLDLGDDNIEASAQTLIDYYGDATAKKFADLVAFLLIEK